MLFESPIFKTALEVEDLMLGSGSDGDDIAELIAGDDYGDDLADMLTGTPGGIRDPELLDDYMRWKALTPPTADSSPEAFLAERGMPKRAVVDGIAAALRKSVSRRLKKPGRPRMNKTDIKKLKRNPLLTGDVGEGFWTKK